ncbi:SIS domain-containing protein, partial [Tilletiopsis washingtonensis]
AALSHAHALLVAEARALVEAAARLEERPKAFENAVRTVVTCIAGGGKLVWTGVGKSGLIARKLHATSLSLGLSSAYLCPVSALHGDLGALSGTWPLAPRAPLLRARAAEYRAPPAPAPDVLCALSHSGESAELLRLLPHAQARGCPILAFTARKDSSLGRAAAAKGAWVDCRTATPIDVSPQALTPADALVPAPTSSTTVALAMGDALVLSVARACGLGVQSFKQNHPGGSLG